MSTNKLRRRRSLPVTVRRHTASSLPIPLQMCSHTQARMSSVSAKKMITDGKYDFSSTIKLDSSFSPSPNTQTMSSRRFRSPRTAKDSRECCANHPLYHKPHKSLLNVFNIFCTVAVLNIPLQIVGVTKCLELAHGDRVLQAVLVLQALLDISFVSVILFALVFLSTFHDAVFVNKAQFSFFIASLFGVSLWVVALKALHPISELLNSRYIRADYPCSLDNSFGKFLVYHETALTSFYGECGIIGAGLYWHIWSSILPAACLKKYVGQPRFQPISAVGDATVWESATSALKRSIRRWRVTRTREGSDEEQHLLPTQSAYAPREEYPLSISFTVSILLGTLYIILSLALANGLCSDISDYTRTYLLWSLHMAFYCPVLVMYRYQNLLSQSFDSFFLKDTVSLLHGMIERHDKILFLSNLSTFTLNILRLVGAVGIISHPLSIPRAELALACFAIAFALFRIISVWHMTSFLVVVQRQDVRPGRETRWTLHCLVYTGVLKASQWLIDIVRIDTWLALRSYYGEIPGQVIGVLLEPIMSIYGIHAAMIAYETYRAIRRPLSV